MRLEIAPGLNLTERFKTGVIEKEFSWTPTPPESRPVSGT